MAVAQFPETPEERVRRVDAATRTEHRLDDDGGDGVALRGHHAPGRLEVSVIDHAHVLEYPVGNAPVGQEQLRRVRVEQVGNLVGLRIVAGTMVSAVHLEDYVALGKCAGGAHRKEAGLAAGVGKTYHVDRGDTVDDDLGKLVLRFRRDAVGNALANLGDLRLDDGRVGVAVDGSSHQVHEVDVLVAVVVDQVVSVADLAEGGIRRKPAYRAGIARRYIFPGLVIHQLGSLGTGSVAVQDLLSCLFLHVHRDPPRGK